MLLLACLPDPTKSCDHLRELVSMLQDINLQHYLSDCVNINNHYEEITKAKVCIILFNIHNCFNYISFQ